MEDGASLLAVVLASLLGSLHCVGMCGGLVGLYTAQGADSLSHVRESWCHLAYNGGRLAIYLLLGLAAGGIGKLIDFTAELGGVRRGAQITAGVLIVLWGLSYLAAASGTVNLSLLGRFPGYYLLKAHLGKAYAAARTAPSVQRALLLGLLTGALPCGWLYLFVTAAASSGSPLNGALIMAAFWLGSVPALLGVGFGVWRISGSVRRYYPVVAGVLMLALGGLTLAGGLRVFSGKEKPCACHQHMAEQ